MSGSNFAEKATGLFSPKHIGAFVQQNPWVIPVAAAAATVMTAGAASPALAASLGGTAAVEGAGLGAAELGAGAAAEMGAGAAGGGLAGASSGLLGSGAAGLGAASLGEAASSGLLSTLGSMGPEQASILAAQNSGLGFGADQATLAAANTAGGGNATLGAQIGNYAGPAAKAFGNYQKAQTALGLLEHPQSGSGSAPAKQPQFSGQIIGQQSLLDTPPSTPYSPYDPLWVAYMHRHPQGASYG
jgi:hypothetical protein